MIKNYATHAGFLSKHFEKYKLGNSLMKIMLQPNLCELDYTKWQILAFGKHILLPPHSPAEQPQN